MAFTSGWICHHELRNLCATRPCFPWSKILATPLRMAVAEMPHRGPFISLLGYSMNATGIGQGVRAGFSSWWEAWGPGPLGPLNPTLLHTLLCCRRWCKKTFMHGWRCERVSPDHAQFTICNNIKATNSSVALWAGVGWSAVALGWSLQTADVCRAMNSILSTFSRFDDIHVSMSAKHASRQSVAICWSGTAQLTQG